MKQRCILLIAVATILALSCTEKPTPEEIQQRRRKQEYEKMMTIRDKKMDTVCRALGITRNDLRSFYIGEETGREGVVYMQIAYSFYTTPTTADTVWHTRVSALVSNSRKRDTFEITSIIYERLKQVKDTTYSADQYTFFNFGSGYCVPGIDSQDINGTKVTRVFAYARMASVIGKEYLARYDLLEKYAQWFIRDTFLTRPPGENFYYGPKALSLD